MASTMSIETIKDCGEKPGQLIRIIKFAKIGELIDCKARVIARSSGNDGIVLTMNVKTPNAAIAAKSDTWNKNVRYSRFGREVVSFLAACSAAPFTFSTGFSPVISDILFFLTFKVAVSEEPTLRVA